MRDVRIGAEGAPAQCCTLRLTRALTQDLQASVHGLRLALDLIAGAPDSGGRYLGLARDEAAQLERHVEQLGLWIRLLGGDVKVRPRRVDLRAVAADRLAELTDLPELPVTVLVDKSLLIPALDGLRDFLKAYALPRDSAGVRIHADGELELFGSPSLLPVLQTVVDNPVPDLAAAKGPAMWLIGPALAVATCRASDGTVWLERSEGGCSLWLAWRRP